MLPGVCSVGTFFTTSAALMEVCALLNDILVGDCFVVQNCYWFNFRIL